MNYYLILKSLVMATALAFAFGYFFNRVARLYKIMETDKKIPVKDIAEILDKATG